MLQRRSVGKTNCVVHWIEIYPVNNIIHLFKNWDLKERCAVIIIGVYLLDRGRPVASIK